jgi:hypothetical protein
LVIANERASRSLGLRLHVDQRTSLSRGETISPIETATDQARGFRRSSPSIGR